MSKTKTLSLTEAQFAEGEELGFKRAALQHALDKSIADGITQEQLDKDVEAAFASARATERRANRAARAEQAAAERRANRAAFAGMALQGLLANVTPGQPEDVAARAIEYADALIEALDNEPVVSE